MRVALLAAGNSIHTVRWANGLASHGVEVNLITQHEVSAPLDSRVQVTKAPFRGTLGYFSMVSRVRRAVREFRPHIVSAHFASGYATTARLIGFHPWMVSVWGSDVYDFPERTPVHKWWVKGNLESADSVASTSRCMAEQTRRVAPALGPIAITPFGVDSEVFSPSLFLRHDESAPIVIGTVKSLTPKYGVDVLIRAFAHVREALQQESSTVAEQLRLRVVGGGPEKAMLERLAKELCVERVTQFVGEVPHAQVPSELAQLDIYAALSRLDSESFGVAVLEASAAGCPVVVSDVGGLPEVVNHGETGFIVPRDDIEAAANAIRQLAVNSELREKFGRAGISYVAEKYSWSACVKTMIETLEKTCQLRVA